MTNVADPAQLQLIVSLASSGQAERAAAVASAIADNAMAAEAWLLLSRINANLQRWSDADYAMRNALLRQPGSRPLALESALLLEQRGEHAAALAALETLAAGGIDSPELLGHLARALQFARRESDAERHLAEGLRRWPVDIALHRQLVQLRWQRGDGEAAFDSVERAITTHPGELVLRLVAADLLRSAGLSQRALGLLEGGLARAPASHAFLTSVGVLLGELGRTAEALRALRGALALSPDSRSAKTNLLPTLLQVGETREALHLVDELLQSSPEDQLLLAWRAVTLRLLGDPGYSWLYDYGRLVRSYTLRPPPRFADIHAFNAALAQAVLALRRTPERPLAQSLRGGTQTERNLPREVPVIADFFAMLDEPIRDYLSRLSPASSHPLDRRHRGGYRIAGSWSVQLRPGGFHANHVHPQGWLSSAYYIELPAGNAAGDEPRAAWLKLGEPAMSKPVCGPDLHVQPEPGKLVLFPSYVWHGTVPFREGGRLTAAFDVIPD